MDISKALVDRLVCAKYVFQRGMELLERSGTYADGLAVLHFQDAVEMFLRVIAEHLHCNIKENSAFNQILDEIDKMGEGSLTHRSALNQLNKARLNFKHYGLQPKHEDAIKFRRDLEAFFPAALSTFMGLNYDSLSLIDLVGHCRTKNYLKRAERLLDEQEYRQSIEASTVAFNRYRSYAGHRSRTRLKNSMSSTYDFGKLDPSGRLSEVIRAVNEDLEQQQKQINLIMDEINLGDYRRFEKLAPRISFAIAGNFHIKHTPGSSNPTNSDASFCLYFVLNAILLMQEYRLPPDHQIPFPDKKYKILRDTNVLVYPSKEPEVIRRATQGEIVPSYYGRYNIPGFVAIVQDDEVAFVEDKDIDVIT